tara:strand:+ start:55 stop:213 length:159 start_codon:yes stop_codon:yes gene_type:complete
MLLKVDPKKITAKKLTIFLIAVAAVSIYGVIIDLILIKGIVKIAFNTALVTE